MKTAEYDIFKQCFSDLWNILKNNSNSPSDLSVPSRKIVSETIIYFSQMLDSVELDNIEEGYVKNWIARLTHVLSLDMKLNNIFTLGYFETNYSNNPQAATQLDISVTLALRALEIGNNGLLKGGTEWKELKKHFPSFYRALNKIFSNHNGKSIVNEFFLLLNTIDALYYLGPDFHKELNLFIKLLKDNEISLNEANEISPGLLIYATDLNARMGLSLTLKDIPLSVNGKPSAFLALSNLNNNNRPSERLLNNARMTDFQHLWWIAQSWDKLIGDTTSVLGILPYYEKLDVDNIFNLVWGDISDLITISVDETEFESVLKLNDEAVQKTLYEYFINHPSVTTYSKANLSQELNKAHTGAEISDFNVELEFANEKIWVAIPIKSGAESKSKDPLKMQQHYLYQFIRPLLDLGLHKTVVFPIILIDPTLNTHEFLSKIRAHLDLPLLLIDTKLYAQFLKKNSLL